MSTAEEYLARYNQMKAKQNPQSTSSADEYLSRYYAKNQQKLSTDQILHARELGVAPGALPETQQLTAPQAMGSAIFNGVEAAEPEIDLRQKNVNAWSEYLRQQNENIKKAEQRLAWTGSDEDFLAYQTQVELYNKGLDSAKSEEDNLEKLRELYTEAYKKEHPEYETNLRRANMLQTVGEWDKENNYTLKADLPTIIRKAKTAKDDVEGQLWLDLIDGYARPKTVEEQAKVDELIDAQIARLKAAGMKDGWEFNGESYERASVYKKQDEITKLEQMKSSMRTESARSRYNSAYEAAMDELPEELRRDIMALPEAMDELKTYTKSGGEFENDTHALAKQQSVRIRLSDLGYDKDQINGMLEYATQTYNAARNKSEAQQAEAEAANSSSFENWTKNVVLGLEQSGELLNLTGQTVFKGMGKADPFSGEKTPVDYNAARIYNLNTAVMSGQQKKVMDRYLAEYDDEEQARKKANMAMGAYQIAVSMGESAVNMGLSAVGFPASSMLLGASSGVSTIMEYKDSGFSDGEALAMGMVSAAAEYFTEKYSVEQFFSMKDVAGKKGMEFLKTAFGNTVRQFLSEGSEEVASDLVNTFGDIMISGMTGKENKLEKEFQSKRAELLLTGMTTEEAEKQAAKQVLWEEFEDLKGSFVAGGISGGLFGIGGTAISAAAGEARDIKTGRAIKKGDFESFRKLAADFGLTLSEDASSRETGKTLRDIQTKATNEAIEKRLSELGEKNNPATRAYLVEAIKAEATGQRLSTKEERALKASKNGAQVAAEYGQMANGEAETETNTWAYDNAVMNELTRAVAVKRTEPEEYKSEWTTAERERTDPRKFGEIPESMSEYGNTETMTEEDWDRYNAERDAERANEDARAAAETQQGAAETQQNEYGSYVRGLMKEMTYATANRIKADENLREAWESITGQKLSGSSRQQTKQIMDGSAMYIGAESYVRGLMMDMDAEAAQEIFDNPAYRDAWERITGKTADSVRAIRQVEMETGSNRTVQWEEGDLPYDGRLNGVRDELMEKNLVDIDTGDGNIKAAVGENRGKWIGYASYNNGQAVTSEGTTRQAAVDNLMKEIENNGRQNEYGARAGSERTVGVGADERVGSLEEEAGQDQSAEGRKERINALDLRRDSAAAQGVANGTETVKNRFFRPGDSEDVDRLIQEDDELATVVNRARDRGQNIIFFTGLLEINEDGKVVLADGAQQGKDIYVRADGTEHSPLKIYEHEDNHAAIEAAGGEKGKLYQSMKERLIRSLGGETQFEALKAKYAEALPDGYSEYDIVQEMLSDARGTMNDFKGNTKLKAELDEEVRKQIGERRTGNWGSGSNRSELGTDEDTESRRKQENFADMKQAVREVLQELGMVSQEAQNAEEKGKPGYQGIVDIDRFKAAQNEYIQRANPVHDDVHAWIRSTDDVLTFEEGLDFDGISADDDVTPDYTGNMIRKALETGYITVYSTNPIKNGNFVTPSRMEAEAYGTNGRLYSKKVKLSDVAWLDSVQGQYTGDEVNADSEWGAKPETGKLSSKGLDTDTEGGNQTTPWTGTDQDNNAVWGFSPKSLYSVSTTEIQKMVPWAMKYEGDLKEKSPFFRSWFGEWRGQSKDSVSTVTALLDPNVTREQLEADRKTTAVSTDPLTPVKNEDTGWYITAGKVFFKDTGNKSDYIDKQTGNHVIDTRTMSIAYNMKDVIKSAVLLDTQISEPKKANKTTTTAYMHKLYAPVFFSNGNPGEEYGVAKLTVETFPQNGNIKNRAYNVVEIEMLPNTSAPSPGDIPGTGYSIGSINTIAELISVVKRFDSDYHPKSSSKVVDEAGRPLVMYQTDSQGKEFSSVKPSGETGEPVYLNLQNPVIIDENGTVTNQGANADGQIIKDKDGIRAIVYAAENVKSVAENIGTYDSADTDRRHSSIGVDADTDNPIYRSGVEEADYGEADTDPIDESVSINRLPKAEAQTVAEEQNYPVLMREDGTTERAIPGWTWVRTADRGNYGYVSGSRGGMLEVTFVNKANDISYTPSELFAPGQLTAVDAEYQGEKAPIGEPPPEIDPVMDDWTDEEFEAMMQEEEDRMAGKATTAQRIVAEGDLNENEESPQKLIREALEDENSLMDVDLAGDAAQYEFILRAKSGKGGNYNKTIDQNMDDLFDNPEDRALAERLIVKPVHDATGSYAKEVEKRTADLARKMQSLGITEDMPENRAIVWYGEGIKQGEGSGLPAEETAEYTLEDLKAEFPSTWKQVKEAAEYMRKMYDEMLDEQNASRSKVYPKLVEKAEAKIKAHKDTEAIMRARSSEQVRILSDLRKQMRAKEATLERTSNPAVRAQLESQIAEMNAEIDRLVKKSDHYDTLAARAHTIAAKLQAEIDSGKITRGKYVPARKDYFHHGREMATGIEGLINTLTTSADIDSGLAGQSEFTKPKAKWQGHLQKRSDAIYNANAIRDMQSYIKAASYVTNIDPAIARLRQQVSYMAQITEKSRNANKMLTWMTDYINQLAGKTNPMDRFLMTKVMGRKALKVMKWVNGRVKANAVGANVRSAIAQFFNLQNCAMLLKNPSDWAAGGQSLVEWLTGDESARAVMNSSDFLSSRYGMGAADNMFETSKLRKASDYMMQFGDEAVARLAWWTAYEKAVNENEANPIYYADDIVRRAVAGRGIGEVPLNQDSEITKFFAPFQVEVNNTFQLVKRKFKEKDFGALAIFALVSYLMNEPLRELFGFDVSWDPINAAIEAVQSVDEDDNAWQATTKIAGRLAGETMSNMAYGSQLTQLLVSDDNTRKKLFGEGDPTRFGTGQIGINMITDPILDLITGDEASEDILEAVLNTALPYGGKQATRLIDTLQIYGVLPEVSISTEDGISAFRQKGGGAAYTASGRLKYAPESTWDNWVRSMLFGNLTTKEGMEYLENGSPMSEEMTEEFRRLTEAGVQTTRAAEIVKGLSEIKNAKGQPTGQKQLDAISYLSTAGISEESQKDLYYSRIASDAQKEKIDAMDAAMMDWNDISDALTTYYALEQDDNLSASQKASALAGWAMSNLTMLQAQTVRDSLTYSSGFKANTNSFDAYVESGLEPMKASEVVMMFSNIRPEAGRDQPTEMQKMYSLSTASYLTDEDRFAVTGAMMGTEMQTASGGMSQYAKMLTAQRAGMTYDDFVSFRAAEKTADKARTLSATGLSNDAKLAVADTFTTEAQSWYLHHLGQYGVSLDVWANFLQMLPLYDADGNGSYKQAEVAEALRAMKLDDDTKAALWQMQTGGSKNPFNPALGKKISKEYKNR